MTTLLISHPASLNHNNGPGHPERPDRLRAIASILEQEKYQDLIRVEPDAAPLETIALCHPMDYIEAIRRRVAQGRDWCSSTPTPRCRRAVSKQRCARSAARCSRSMRL